LSGNGFVGLVSLSELLAHFFSRCVVVFLEPWVGHDIRDGKTLMRMEVQHGGDKVLELFGEEVRQEFAQRHEANKAIARQETERK
jgi:hypothetical protein